MCATATVTKSPALKDELRRFWETKIEISSVSDVFRNTRGQSLNKVWYEQRHFRISASTGRKVERARNVRTSMNYFFGSECNHPNLTYGRAMEAEARQKYEEVTGNRVLECGLVIKKSQPWLCATPDGIYKSSDQDFNLLEIKCPSSCRQKKIQVDCIQDNKLKKNSPYYTQVQLQLYVSDAKSCEFFVYSSEDYVLLSVERNDADV